MAGSVYAKAHKMDPERTQARHLQRDSVESLEDAVAQKLMSSGDAAVVQAAIARGDLHWYTLQPSGAGCVQDDCGTDAFPRLASFVRDYEEDGDCLSAYACIEHGAWLAEANQL